MKLAQVRKFLVSVLATAAIAAQAAITDGTITREEWSQIALAAVGSVLVYWVRNARPVTRADLAREVGPTRFRGRDDDT
jgi:hypothetical protein